MVSTEDRFAWLRDDEFARQAIAGVNPVTIQRLEVFPPVSKLDPQIYGPQESALKEEHILGHLNGMTVQQVPNYFLSNNNFVNWSFGLCLVVSGVNFLTSENLFDFAGAG